MVNTHAKCASPTPAKSPANPQKLQKKWRGTPTKGSLASDLYRCLREPTESLLRRAASVRHGRVDHDRVEAVVERIEKFSGRHEIEEIATRRRYHANSSAAIVEPGEKLVLCADVKAVDILKHNRSPIESRKVSVCARDPRHERHRQVGAERDYCRRRRRFLPTHEHVRADAEQAAKVCSRRRACRVLSVCAELDMRYPRQMHKNPFEMERTLSGERAAASSVQWVTKRKSAQPDVVCKSRPNWLASCEIDDSNANPTRPRRRTGCQTPAHSSARPFGSCRGDRVR